jgi:hypothetical protein
VFPVYKSDVTSLAALIHGHLAKSNIFFRKTSNETDLIGITDER